MLKPALVAVPLLVVLALTGCAVPAADSNPLTGLEDVIETIPWAKDIADTATAQELTARIDELTAALPNLELSDAKRDEIEAKLVELRADVSAATGDTGELVEQLRAIIAEIAAG